MRTTIRRMYAPALTFALLVVLAACGGKAEETPPPPSTTPVPSTAQPVAESSTTPHPTDLPAVELTLLEPALIVRDGLTVLSENSGALNDTVYFFAALRNDTDQTLNRVDVTVTMLAADGFQLGQFTAPPPITDIPPGQAFYVGGWAAKPNEYAGAERRIWYETGTPRFVGHFGLPAEVSEQAPDENGGYLVRGTVTNDSADTLVMPVVTVALVGADEKVIGLTNAALQLPSADGTWPAGTSADFEARFTFVAGDTQNAEAHVFAVGYVLPAR